MTTAETAVFTEEEARELTERIKTAVEDLWAMIQEAYTSRAWLALGYESWDAYCGTEFGSLRPRLPRDERQDVVASLRESGLSVRAIASATGSSTRTVQLDLQVWSGTTPEIQGADGKTYKPKAPPVDQPEKRGTCEPLRGVPMAINGARSYLDLVFKMKDPQPEDINDIEKYLEKVQRQLDRLRKRAQSTSAG
ncbi:hypothetical protein ACFUN8_18500 [Streptomyces sp. NPDC057307]|uniref:hypothetical protein n=1 Tax=Streptomyces sp. NPDC057307 TaxID=3346096 RepID=UPI003633C5E6